MAFIANTPLATQKLKDSKPQLLGNNIQLDASFGVDHYTFSNGTTDNGKHNQVTTPNIVGAVHPTTLADEPKFYGMQDSTQSGVLQYSRGPSDAVPSPLTRLHGFTPGVANGATINVFDFGLPDVITRSIAVLMTYVEPLTAEKVRQINCYWDGTTLIVKNVSVGGVGITLNGTSTGSILQILNSTGSAATIYWTLEFQRLQ
jgi:hypothetical protein